MYNKIKEEIKSEYYQQNFANDGQRFVAWYLRNIHLRDMNQTKYDLTDGKDDKQIDAVFINEENRKIYIIQGKFYQNETTDAKPVREIISCWSQLDDLKQFQESCNGKLKQKIQEISAALDDDYEICFELITTSKFSDEAKLDIESFEMKLAKQSDDYNTFAASFSVIDNTELKRLYDSTLELSNPSINFQITLDDHKYLYTTISDTNVIIASLPLKDCINIPGINDGTLFQKNVRQSLGINNTVNKRIKQTIYDDDKNKDFFFFHNGITAICNKMEKIGDNTFKFYGLSVVNGCQSLNTILACSEKVKNNKELSVLFRFYEIPQRDKADRISINTNTQSTVKARDLRSNDKKVLKLKKAFEQRYTNGYLITKRGEVVPAEKEREYVVDLSELGKYLMAWYSQRPNISYGETKIFDKYYDTIFKPDYKPENIHALNYWMIEIMKKWTIENPLILNETLLAMKSYAPYHYLFAISECFCVINNNNNVPSPSKCLEIAKRSQNVEFLLTNAGFCLNNALQNAVNNQTNNSKVFSPQNWIKSKNCLNEIKSAVNQHFSYLLLMQQQSNGNGIDFNKIKASLKLNKEDFQYRLSAD